MAGAGPWLPVAALSHVLAALAFIALAIMACLAGVAMRITAARGAGTAGAVQNPPARHGSGWRWPGLALAGAAGVTALWAVHAARLGGPGFLLDAGHAAPTGALRIDTLLGTLLEWLRTSAWLLLMQARLNGGRRPMAPSPFSPQSAQSPPSPPSPQSPPPPSPSPASPSRLLWPALPPPRSLPSLRLQHLLLAMLVLQLALHPAWRWSEQALPAFTAGALPVIAITSRLVLAVLGMLLIEHVYRSTDPRQRWGVKFACIAMGGLFAYDFYLYSDCLLFRQVNLDIWAARGVVDALCVPLLGLAAVRNRDGLAGAALARHATPAPTPTSAAQPSLIFSRQLMFGSATLLGSAIYLLAMAASAWYLRYVGGAWGAVMQLACLFGAALLLVGVLFSGAMRARLKVAINKHFYRGRFDYRQEWLRLTRALSDGGPALPERTIQAVAGLVESPAGALWIRREGDVCAPVASWNMPLPDQRDTPEESLCRFFDARQWVVDLAEWRAQPQRYGELRLPAWLAALPGAWLLVPLTLHGRLFGFICLARPRIPMALDWEMRDVLKIASSQAASYLAHRESADSLAVARQFESYNRMSTFLVHDLKNLVSQLSLLLINAERHQANPAFQQDLLATLAHSVARMKLLLQRLSRGDAPEVAVPLLLDQLLAQAVNSHGAATHADPRPVLELRSMGVAVLADGNRLLRVLGHLIQNAVEATPRGGSVTVRLWRQERTALIELRDTGQGMSEEFIRERLFKPFESTKPAGMGIGVFESREYIRGMGGRLEVSSAPGHGTTFRVTLPLHINSAAA